MRKIIFLGHVSLDGYMARPNDDMSWITYDDELADYGHQLHATTDTAIYGRRTFQNMDSYWPTVLANPDSKGPELDHARWYDSATKIVVSRSLDNVQSKNTIVIRDNIAAEMMKIKQQPGKNLWLLGSPRLAQVLSRLRLIDEYWINVNPVILGSGTSFSTEMEAYQHLKLLNSQTFTNGVVALRYESLPVAASQSVSEAEAKASA